MNTQNENLLASFLLLLAYVLPLPALRLPTLTNTLSPPHAPLDPVLTDAPEN